jgi:hypothetical protein
MFAECPQNDLNCWFQLLYRRVGTMHAREGISTDCTRESRTWRILLTCRLRAGNVCPCSAQLGLCAFSRLFELFFILRYFLMCGNTSHAPWICIFKLYCIFLYISLNITHIKKLHQIKVTGLNENYILVCFAFLSRSLMTYYSSSLHCSFCCEKLWIKRKFALLDHFQNRSGRTVPQRHNLRLYLFIYL